MLTVRHPAIVNGAQLAAELAAAGVTAEPIRSGDDVIFVGAVEKDRTKITAALAAHVPVNTPPESVEARVAAVEAEVRALKVPEWKQPTGAHDAVPNGGERRHNGQVWRSLIPANTTTPGSDPRWWEPVTS